MDFDALVVEWVRELFWPALIGSLAAFAYLSLLARAHARAQLLVALLRECRRRLARQERMRESLGFAPRLERYRRLERDLTLRLGKEGLP
ncbi:MAG: hypothetical protein HY293_01410 [Planctomycetes bacterium]|nr:hypothetical protein [Planctomycetota bacterium]